MDHVAIMRKSWKLTQKILSGEKKIESRWYSNKSAPWDRIKAGESVYFKDSGEPVTIKASVERVLQFSELTPHAIKEILDKFGGVDGINISDMSKFYERFKHKRYCLLIFLRNAQKIKPFNVNKKGFGNMAAWLCVRDVDAIKL
jgi:ASC-1-like (ASCH) protein